MSMMSLWDSRKDDDYRFIDNQVREMFRIGGVQVLLHKYLGVVDQGEQGDATQPSAAKSKKKGVRQIQDLFFLENRDRAYDTTIYELRGSYQVQDMGFSMGNFAMFLDGDVMFLEFHSNDILEKLDRKLMIGDVLEFPHLRDDALLDESKPAVNKYYVVDDVTRAATGWSQVWRSHMFRVKLKPLTDSQEYRQILERKALDVNGDEGAFDVRSLISDFRDFLGDEHDSAGNPVPVAQRGGISDCLVTQAESDVPFRNFQTAHFYVVPGDEMGSQYPWVFAGDGKPPNGAQLAGSGTSFPPMAQNGDWFLHTGMDPYVLYQFVSDATGLIGQVTTTSGGVWERREVDLRKKWSAAHRILSSFINNTNVNPDDQAPERVALSRAVLPKADV